MLMIVRLCLRSCIQQRPNVGTECEVPSNVGNFLQRFPYPVRTFLRAQLAHVFTALPNSFPSDYLRSLVMEKIRYKPQGRKCKLFLQEFGPPASPRCKLNFLFKYYINVNISSKTEIRELSRKQQLFTISNVLFLHTKKDNADGCRAITVFYCTSL